MRTGLFVTCLTDTFFPETGEAVLERLGTVEFQLAQSCCGQIHFNTGYGEELLMARGSRPRRLLWAAVTRPRGAPRWSGNATRCSRKGTLGAPGSPWVT
jgi:L-lactate dehydrogenase complex protein LldE